MVQWLAEIVGFDPATTQIAREVPFMQAMANPVQDLNEGEVLWLVPAIDTDGWLTRGHWEMLSLDASSRKLQAAETVRRVDIEQALQSRLQPLLHSRHGGFQDGTRLTCSLVAEVGEELMNTHQDGSALPTEPGEDRRSEAMLEAGRDIENSKETGVEGAEAGDLSFRQQGRTLEEILIERGRQVPQEEWDRLPADLIDRLDFYTSGADV